MKQVSLIFLFLLFGAVSAQNTSEEKTIQQLSKKIQTSEKGEKLKWMDSLGKFVMRSTQKPPDSILRATIEYALEIDSLNIAIFNLTDLMDFYNNVEGNPEVALEEYEKLGGMARKLSNPRTLAKLYLNLGDSYYYLKDFKKSTKFYDTTEMYAKRAKDKRFEALALLYRAGNKSLMGDFAESSMELQRAIPIFRHIKDSASILSAQNSLAILYSQNGFFAEAETVRNEAIELGKALGDKGNLITLYYNSAADYRKQGMPKERIASLKRAEKAAEDSDHLEFYRPVILSSLAIAYAQTDSLEKARHYVQRMQNDVSFKEGRNRDRWVHALKNVRFAEGKYNEALSFAKEHLALQKGKAEVEEIQNAEKFIAKVYDSLGNDKLAFQHYKEYDRIKDSIFSVQKAKGLSYYQTLYETEKRDAQITAQKSDIALLNAKSKLKNQWILFGGLGLLALFGGVVMVRSRNAAKRRQKMQEKFSQELIKTQEEERVRVARELHDGVGQKLMMLTKRTKTKGDADMESLADNTLQELRSISRGLHPSSVEKLGITKAIENLINEIDANTNIFFTNEIENIDAEVPPEVALHLYRIIQEILNNMVKHSEANTASISIVKQQNGIEAAIKDNGKGFEFSKAIQTGSSLGMRTLLERAKIINSKLTITSEPAKGTLVLLQIPK